MTASSHLQHAASAEFSPVVGLRSAGDVIFFVIASCATLFGLCGNVLVVTAIATNKKLRRSANALNGSLAVADILVETTVMSLCIVSDSMGYWPLGDRMCRVWISLDVMCTTASILSISGIAFDRYLHVRDPFLYDRVISRRVIIAAISIIWSLSVVISFLPVFLKLNEPPRPNDDAADVSLAGSMFYSFAATEANRGHAHPYRFNLTNIGQIAGDDFSLSPPNELLMSSEVRVPDVTTSDMPNASHFSILESTLQPLENPTCKFEANPIYAITSSTISFYIPCVVLVVVYAKLFRIARGHMRSIKGVRRVPRLKAVGGSGTLAPAVCGAAVGNSPRPLTPIVSPRMLRNGSEMLGPSRLSSRQSSIDNGNAVRLHGDLLEIHWLPSGSLKTGTLRENSNQSNSNQSNTTSVAASHQQPNARQDSMSPVRQESAATITPNSDNINVFDLMTMSNVTSNASCIAQPISLETALSAAASSGNSFVRRLSNRRSSFGDALTIQSASSNAVAAASPVDGIAAAQGSESTGHDSIAHNKNNNATKLLLSPHSMEGSTPLRVPSRKLSVSERNLAMVSSPSASSSLNRFASTLLQVPLKLHSTNHNFFRDQKASITLGVIMSSFFVCWFPFFTVNGTPVRQSHYSTHTLRVRIIST